MTDLVPDQPIPKPAATYCGPYGEFPVPNASLMERTGYAQREQIRTDNSDPGDEQPEPAWRNCMSWADARELIRRKRAELDADADSLTIAAHKIAQLEAEVERLRSYNARYSQESEQLRATLEQLRRERVEVEQALGCLVHEGQLGAVVRKALYRESGRA